MSRFTTTSGSESQHVTYGKDTKDTAVGAQHYLLLGQCSLWAEELTVLPTERNHQKETTVDKRRRVGGKGLKLQVCQYRNGTELLVVSVQE